MYKNLAATVMSTRVAASFISPVSPNSPEGSLPPPPVFRRAA